MVLRGKCDIKKIRQKEPSPLSKVCCEDGVRMDNVTEIMSKMFGRYTSTWGIIDDFRQVSRLGLEANKEDILQKKYQLMDYMLNSGQFDNIFLDKEYFMTNIDNFANGMTEQTIANAKASVEAATIIFIHTMLDTIITDLCRVTMYKYPERWDDELDKMEITFKHVKNNRIDNIRIELINNIMKQVERSSMLDRMNFLYRRCKLGSREIMRDYKFDKEQIKMFDKLRHNIVHGQLPVTDISENLLNLLFYLKKTGYYFMVMVLVAYDIKIESSAVFNIKSKGEPVI